MSAAGPESGPGEPTVTRPGGGHLPARLVAVGLALLVVYGGARAALNLSARPGRLSPRVATLRWQSGPAGAGSPSNESPAFEVVNDGGTPVHVASLETSCGCTVPGIEPATVAPGGVAVVRVKPQPLDIGEKRVSIALNTSSPVTPRVALTLVIVGARRPPYLGSAHAEPAGAWSDDPGATHEVVVKTVEPPGLSLAPVPQCDLPFLAFDPAEVSEGAHPGDPSLVVRTYRFPARFAAPPPAEPFNGRVTVVDPWDAGRTLAVVLTGRPTAAIRVAPPRPVLTLDGPDDRASTARFLITTSSPKPGLAVSPGESPLSVVRQDPRDSDRVFHFRVSWPPGRPPSEGTYHLVARPGPPGEADLVIPVTVRVRAVGWGGTAQAVR